MSPSPHGGTSRIEGLRPAGFRSSAAIGLTLRPRSDAWYVLGAGPKERASAMPEGVKRCPRPARACL